MMVCGDPGSKDWKIRVDSLGFKKLNSSRGFLKKPINLGS